MEESTEIRMPASMRAQQGACVDEYAPGATERVPKSTHLRDERIPCLGAHASPMRVQLRSAVRERMLRSTH